MTAKLSLLVFLISVFLMLRITGVDLANQSRQNQAVRPSSLASLTLTNIGWEERNINQHSVRRDNQSPQQVQREYFFMLEPRRIPVQSKAITGENHRLLRKRNEPQANDFFLNKNGRIWELSSDKKADNTQLTAKTKQVSKIGIQSRELIAGIENSSFSTDNKINSNCHMRSLTRMLTSAKNLLSKSMKQVASRGDLVLGSSLLAAAIPLAVLVLPETRSNKKQRGNGHDENSSLGIFSVQNRVDSVMGWIERSVEHLPNFPRLHPQECVKRSICEAHNEPDRYGAIGFILRLFFPATNLSSTDRMDNMEYKVINKYRHAAGYGLNKRIENNGTSSSACKEKYEDCLVSLLEVAQNLIDVFLKN